MMELTRRLRAFGMAEAKAGIGRTRRELFNEAADEIDRLREALIDIEKLSEDGTAAKMISRATLQEKHHEPG